MPIAYSKYHALGNDYLVLPPLRKGPRGLAGEGRLDPRLVRRICHRNFGAGSDGILHGPLKAGGADFGLRIYNPDGSEAEKSGNGLRIFSRYLWDRGLVKGKPFRVSTPGGLVLSRVHPGGGLVTVEMGRVTFDSREIPVKGPARQVLNETMKVGGRTLKYCAASIGNPHCVVPCREISEKLARDLGPSIETEPRFPNRTNVQFLKVLDRRNIQIEIWERGAGYTLASGSSSSAAAAVARRLGLCGPRVRVHMPGGVLEISMDAEYRVTMKGPVTRVSEGFLAEEMLK